MASDASSSPKSIARSSSAAWLSVRWPLSADESTIRSSSSVDRLDPDEAQQPVRSPVEQANQGTGEPQVDPHRRRKRSCDRLGLGDGQVLRGEFAEHHLRHRGQDQRQDQRDAEGRRFGYADRHERWFDHRRDCRFGDEAHEQRGDRDAQLGARQHETEALVDVDRPLRTAVALLGPLQETASTCSHEREFDSDEEPIGRDERDHCDQPESSQHGVNFVFGRQTWVDRCYRPPWPAVATRCRAARLRVYHHHGVDGRCPAPEWTT
jgi:hypothetical protein